MVPAADRLSRFTELAWKRWETGIHAGEPKAIDALNRLLETMGKRKMPELTPRQIEVLYEAADGYTSIETAKHLYISTDTVKAHKKRILLVLGARNITHAVAIAIRDGWI